MPDQQPPALHSGPPSDFNIKPPADAPAAPNPAPGQPAPGQLQPPPAPGLDNGGTPIQQGGTPISAAGLPPDNVMTTTEEVVGIAVVLVLAVAIFLVRGAVRNHLISHRASPASAGSAGWALFACLLSVSVLIVFGLLGNLWPVLAFTAPLSVLSLAMLVLFVLLYRGAAKGRMPRRR